jgi:hypothetical protein
MWAMHRNCIRRPAACFITLAAGALLLQGCSTLSSHWPFSRHAAPAPEPVAELQVERPGGGAPPVVLQYWERNTLVLDLNNVSSQGQVTLRPAEGRGWPARIAMRMPPRRFDELEVRGAQRVVLPLAAGSVDPVTVALPPGIYDGQTAEITVSWGASGSF